MECRSWRSTLFTASRIVARDFACDTIRPLFRIPDNGTALGPEITDDAPDRAARWRAPSVRRTCASIRCNSSRCLRSACWAFRSSEAARRSASSCFFAACSCFRAAATEGTSDARPLLVATYTTVAVMPSDRQSSLGDPARRPPVSTGPGEHGHRDEQQRPGAGQAGDEGRRPPCSRRGPAHPLRARAVWRRRGSWSSLPRSPAYELAAVLIRASPRPAGAVE